MIQSLTTGSTLILSSNALELYPNPSSERIYLNFNGNYNDVLITIYSIEGKEVYIDKASLLNGLKELPLTELPLGVYMVEIKIRKGKLTKRLIKN